MEFQQNDDPLQSAVQPLTREELEKFLYHLSVATVAFRTLNPPDCYIQEFIALTFRIIETYRRYSEDRWKSEDKGG